jgi:2'-5' RNA ligase
LPDPVLVTLGSVRETFLAGAPAWAGEKWVARPLLHVTLAFLGALDDSALEADVPRLRKAMARLPAFELRLAGVAAVPSPRRATMLWATLSDPGEALTDLRDELLAAFPSAGAVPDAGPLRPHVTLVRARSPRRVDLDALAEAAALAQAAGKEPDGVVSVRSVTLFSSTLRPAGPEYREIAVAELAR